MAIADLFKRILPGKDEVPAEDDEQDKKLMELFQKRNLLKRLYDKAAADLASTKEEAESLQRQAGAMGQRLNALDEMLSDPEKGQSVIVFYQLAELWSQCNSLIAERAYELSQRLEAEERQKLIADFTAAQRVKLQAADDKLRFARAQAEEANLRMRQLTTELAASQRFWHYFKRKRLVADIAQHEQVMTPLVARDRQLAAELEQLQQAPAPEYPGLSVPAKRAINLQLIATAQYLYRELLEHSVGQHAQNAHGVLPNANSFGDTRTCLQLVTHIAEATNRLRNDGERQLKLSQRVAFLQEKSKYASGDVALPEREVYAAIDGSVGAGTREVKAFDMDAGRMLINVVDGNYFGLKDQLLE